MQILVFLEVSDRKEMAGIRGLHARILLKMACRNNSFSLVGTATLSDEIEIATVGVEEDVLDLGAETATILLTAGFNACWNAVVLGGCAAACMRWHPLLPWLVEHLDVDQIPAISRRIGAAFNKPMGLCNAASS